MQGYIPRKTNWVFICRTLLETLFCYFIKYSKWNLNKYYKMKIFFNYILLGEDIYWWEIFLKNYSKKHMLFMPKLKY